MARSRRPTGRLKSNKEFRASVKPRLGAEGLKTYRARLTCAVGSTTQLSNRPSHLKTEAREIGLPTTSHHQTQTELPFRDQFRFLTTTLRHSPSENRFHNPNDSNCRQSANLFPPCRSYKRHSSFSKTSHNPMFIRSNANQESSWNSIALGFAALAANSDADNRNNPLRL
jgi:hypothetical protein